MSYYFLFESDVTFDNNRVFNVYLWFEKNEKNEKQKLINVDFDSDNDNEIFEDADETVEHIFTEYYDKYINVENTDSLLLNKEIIMKIGYKEPEEMEIFKHMEHSFDENIKRYHQNNIFKN
ncbi:uncharacterized protein ASCRUDRAFT_67350 [Ascoidea rubescens DSM 1968]|uniref:Uncharacterized protein n=1 Tax=Ascoidea rubescens DSM 1968 TaxID=1344418 RepID=A0A1D2VNR2_9ASCO|nr:hypothetical protein ASCRUDRAFT_67350 [Ascoidea rubescens DSM 1968]ODV63224.1 hypothetical protein ASCRUDRAFT_67350 [Ascoidea rubescens DSM 1968]